MNVPYLFNHSPGDGLWAVSKFVNKAALNICVNTFSFLLGKYPGVELLGCIVSVCLIL